MQYFQKGDFLGFLGFVETLRAFITMRLKLQAHLLGVHDRAQDYKLEHEPTSAQAEVKSLCQTHK